MEYKKDIKSNLLNRTVAIVLSVLVLILGQILTEINQFIAGGTLIAGAIFIYFFTVYKIEKRNYLAFIAVSNAVWIATIGLAQLRLLGYQKVWNGRTWLNLIITSVLFQIAMPLGHKITNKIFSKFDGEKNFAIGRLKFEFKQHRLFWICLCTTVIAVALFVWNILIKGYVPFFSSIFNAYTLFYTKRMVFVTAAAVISPMAYWCIKKCDLTVFKKILMYICIAINTFIIPILQVNRGVFIVASLMLTGAVFYLNGKRFLIMLVCLTVTFGFYEVASLARNYSNEYLDIVFEPVDFGSTNSKPNTDDDNVDSDDDRPEEPSEEPGGEPDSDGFKLPSKVAFLYGYFTVSHDNFNEAVVNAYKYTYGVRQLAPFNVILRSEAISEAIYNAEYYIVKSNLNTANLISGVYYDLRELGVIIFVLIWGIVLGIIEMVYLKSKNVFALVALGNALTPVALSFFVPWFENFTLWLFWGTTILLMLCSCINISAKKNKE